MDHQVLARKWRPRNFKQMVGQEHVLKALINALDQNRLHHAYLFTGTRGVGKTTIARILAKCLNCEQGVTSDPCNQCSTCLEINEGRCIDLIEVDAASRTKVEDTRELLDNVQYLPTRARFKVYLIDEVHMLSGHSFNALLKTLEEPPPHVKFLLATTDPQKLPVTVLSRCLQFNLKNMSPERIAEHLKYVLGEENVRFDEGALWQLGRAADGSMRDALSLTDQAIAYGENSVLEADVSSMLGSIDRGRVYQIFDALIKQDAAQILAQVTELAEYSPDYLSVLDELISLLHRLAVTQAVPDAPSADNSDAEMIKDFARQITAEDVQLYYQIALIGRRDLPLNADLKAGLEMVLLRMLAFTPVAPDNDQQAKKKLTNNPAADLSSAEKVSAGAAPAASLGSTPARTPSTAPASAAPVKGQSKAAQALALARGDAPPKSRANLDLVVDNAGQPGKAEPAATAEPLRAKSETPAAAPPAAVDDSRAAPAVEPAQDSATAADQGLVNDARPRAPDQQDEALPASATSEQAAQTSATRFSLEALNTNEDWIALVQQVAIRGMSKNILLQCAFRSRDQNRIALIIDPQYIDLLNASHQDRIKQALCESLNTAVRIDVQAGTSEHETPAAWQQRLKEQGLRAAREALETDEKVMQIIEKFGATIEVDSIEPLD